MSEKHRCAGCGHRWDGPLTGAELCGDCWRTLQTLCAKDDAVVAEANDEQAWELPTVVPGTTHVYPVVLTPHQRVALMSILSDYISGAPRVEVSVDALTGDELTPGELLRLLVQLDPIPMKAGKAG
jgi:hypothetical protein